MKKQIGGMTVEEMIAKKKKKSVKSIELTQSIELLSLNKGEENEKSQRSVVPGPTSSSLPPGAEALL